MLHDISLFYVIQYFFGILCLKCYFLCCRNYSMEETHQQKWYLQHYFLFVWEIPNTLLLRNTKYSPSQKYQILSFSEIPNTLLRNTKYSSSQKYQILSSEIPNTLLLRNSKYSPSQKYQILSSEISNTLLLRNTKYSPQKYQMLSFSEIPNNLLLRNTKYSPSLNLNNVDAIMTFLAKLTLEWLNKIVLTSINLCALVCLLIQKHTIWN